MYNIVYDYDQLELEEMTNKLFCTFTPIDELDFLLENIKSRYSIMYNKIFVLHIENNNEYACTYNVDNGNVKDIINNTILVHRKKEYNVLYTINSINELIKSLNNGVIDRQFPIDWKNYKNSILLTQNGGLKQLNTKIYKIIEI
jgi:hypothetical protein